MASLLVQAPDMGLNALLPQNMRDPREAGDHSQNLLYEYGLMKTPFGFAKLDLTSTGLNSGDTVLHILPFTELDKTGHHIAVTTEKIYDHDRVNNEWDDKTQSGVTMNSDIYHPVSYAEIGHDDTDIYIDDDTGKNHAYHHLIVCDGGLSNIQRWAGKYEADFGDLVGGGGYHDGTTHRALQVSLSEKNRILLLSPFEYDSASKTWIENNQRIRWPTVGKIQTWTGTGSGFADLLDTGGLNVWSAKLGGQHIIYQTKGIWALNYVGGTDIYKPKPAISDLGLLAWHLLVSYNNVHYFVGTDYNVHAYYGGTVKRTIGDKIQKYLKEDLDPTYEYRCWMSMDVEGKRLWIFIVPQGSTYITKAYGMDMRTGNWMIRDFLYKREWSMGGGVTAVNLMGGDTYTVGETYAEALDKVSVYSADVSKSTAGEVTERYGELIEDGTINVIDWSVVDETLDFTQVAFSTGGLSFCFTTKTGEATELVGDNTDYSNLIIRIDDGSDSTNMPYGSHYYTMTDISIETDAAGISAKVNLAPRDSTSAATTATGFAAADNSSNIPAIGTDCTATIYDPSGSTYRDDIEEVQTSPKMFLGDSDGFVYEFDSTYTDDDGGYIIQRHFTIVFDWKEPDSYKRWPGIVVVAEGTDNGAMYVGYRTSDFDTSDTGWTDFTFDLTGSYLEKTFWINQSSKEIQYQFIHFKGKYFAVREFKILEPEIQENR